MVPFLPMCGAQIATRSQVHAQIAGNVLDPSGAVVAGAHVQLTGPEGFSTSVTTDATGHYAFSNLFPGSYTLQADAPGFSEQTLGDLAVAETASLFLNIRLKIVVEQQTVHVTQNDNDSSPAKNADALVMKGHDLDLFSTNSDQMLQQLQAVSGIGGSGSSQLYVDGFSNGKMPPKDTIREIRINENPYSAEYQEQGFDRIEVFTKPGSDKLHAEATAYGTDSALDSQNPFAPEPQPFHTFELDADVNGPLGKKTSFLAAILRRQEANIAIVNAEGLNGQNQPVSITDAVNNPTGITGISTKLDRQVTPTNTLTSRLDFRGTKQNNAGIGQLQLASQGYDILQNFATLQLSDSQIFGSRVINDVRFQYQRSRSSQAPLSTAPALVVQGAFTGGGSDLGRVTDNQDQYEFQDAATFDLGKHYLRAGVRERFNRDANNSTANYNGEYIFSSVSVYQTAQLQVAAGAGTVSGASQFNITSGQSSATVTLSDTALYLEDTWKLTKKLTASYGLRFETQNHIADHHDFAPRIGASYNIGGDAKNPPIAVLQTGFGLFYSRFPTADLLQAKRLDGVLQSQYVLNSPVTYPSIPTLDELQQQQQFLPTLYRIGDRYHSPYSVSTNISLEHSFASIGAVTVGYNYARGVHLLLSRNINAPLQGTYNPSDPASGIRPFGVVQNIYEYDTQGVSTESHLFLNTHIQATKAATLFATYFYGFVHSDTNGSFPAFQYDVGADYGRASNDERNRLFVGGLFNLPFSMSGTTYLIAASGDPFDIVLGEDLNGDSQFNDRPAFATDLTRASVVHTRFGVFDTNPTQGQTVIPNNYGQGPGLLLLNTYWDKTFHFGPAMPAAPDAPPVKAGQQAPSPDRKYSLKGGVEIDNVLNHVNAASPVGVLGSPLFGRSNAIKQQFQTGSANRQVQFLLGFQF